MTNPSAVAAFRAALRKRGVVATLRRISGYAPNVTVLASVEVMAIARNVAYDANETAQAGLHGAQPGAIEQADRRVEVLGADLADAGFPLPVKQGDQVVLPDAAELLNVLRVDAYSRTLTGAIVLTVVGVS